ncbi:Uncharacterised protein [Mycobacteroides abscessus subsp. abscessus]|nr:Uncharacterised protein [Mycobacteroides abscessus subsp. abscessus]SII37128.1 Uncharacterised protein [Mycobacteroides abscessus subsp. abscessus]SIJ12861.1 Uncharacterised protein [Mycobacteroides abscessus subsp. abscessus]SIJ49313.1 Uncharacterised protein [Mycobacteroides abscessus subsp. abscessus]SIM14587.1 Uncharacterised protein [Mycobacteroides abscessus subsp. abscessus]
MGRVAGGPQAVENRLWRPRLGRTLEGMEVTFVKRRNGYDVRIRRERGPELTPRGGPGGRPPVPHDAAHLIVEQEARLRGGVFGRLADANGLDGLFWPVDPAERRKASRRNRKPTAAQAADMAQSEYLASLTAALWEVERGHRQAAGPWPGPAAEVYVEPALLDRIFARYDDFAPRWAELPDGGELTLLWR